MWYSIALPPVLPLQNMNASRHTSAQWNRRTGRSQILTARKGWLMAVISKHGHRRVYSPGRWLAQSGRVVGDGLYFLFGHARGDAAHHPVLVVRALSALERLELRLDVLGVLARDPGVERGNPRAVRA